MYTALHFQYRFNKNSLLQCYFLEILPAGLVLEKVSLKRHRNDVKEIFPDLKIFTVHNGLAVKFKIKVFANGNFDKVIMGYTFANCPKFSNFVLSQGFVLEHSANPPRQNKKAK